MFISDFYAAIELIYLLGICIVAVISILFVYQSCFDLLAFFFFFTFNK